ncbi:MAG: hypothetical protein J3R72DRAFT_3006, partial [Linnemannia gamsii]
RTSKLIVASNNTHNTQHASYSSHNRITYAHLVQGSSLGFGEACAAERRLCVVDHFNAFLALTTVALMVFELTASWMLMDESGYPLLRRTRTTPAPPQIIPVPVPTPVLPQQGHPDPKQQERVQEQDQQSTLSTTKTLKDEEAASKKLVKRRSTGTIYSSEDLELGLYPPEQGKVPNPNSLNRGSKPNQDL